MAALCRRELTPVQVVKSRVRIDSQHAKLLTVSSLISLNYTVIVLLVMTRVSSVA